MDRRAPHVLRLHSPRARPRAGSRSRAGGSTRSPPPPRAPGCATRSSPTSPTCFERDDLRLAGEDGSARARDRGRGRAPRRRTPWRPCRRCRARGRASARARGRAPPPRRLPARPSATQDRARRGERLDPSRGAAARHRGEPATSAAAGAARSKRRRDSRATGAETSARAESDDVARAHARSAPAQAVTIRSAPGDDAGAGDDRVPLPLLELDRRLVPRHHERRPLAHDAIDADHVARLDEDGLPGLHVSQQLARPVPAQDARRHVERERRSAGARRVDFASRARDRPPRPRSRSKPKGRRGPRSRRRADRRRGTSRWPPRLRPPRGWR